LCFLAGANSIFYGDKLLTTENPDEHHDRGLFAKLGIRAEGRVTCHEGDTVTRVCREPSKRSGPA
jgi:biotin synthase